METMTIRIPKRCKKAYQKRALRAKTQDYVDKVLADDIDGDYDGLIRLIRHKISRMRACIVGNNIVEDAGEIGRQMRVVEDALERLDKDDYHFGPVTELNKKYGVKYAWIDKKKDGKAYKTLGLVPIKKGTRFDEKKYRVEFRRVTSEGDKERRRDLKIAFDGIRDNVEGWWD